MERIKAVANRIASWHRLATTPLSDKRFGIILSSYPGRPHQVAHAVGLDALASVESLLGDQAALTTAARHAAEFGRRDATRDLAQLALGLAAVARPQGRAA